MVFFSKKYNYGKHSVTCAKVTVRQRAIRNGQISLYLDYYPAIHHPETMIMSRREYLGIYIYAHPKNEMEREFNATNREKTLDNENNQRTVALIKIMCRSHKSYTQMAVSLNEQGFKTMCLPAHGINSVRC